MEERINLTAAPHGGTSLPAGRRVSKLSMAIAQAKNQKAAQYFAVSMAGVIIVFSVLHWTRLMYRSRFTR